MSDPEEALFRHLYALTPSELVEESERMFDIDMPRQRMTDNFRRRIVGRSLDRFHSCRCACRHWWRRSCGPCLWCGR